MFPSFRFSWPPRAAQLAERIVAYCPTPESGTSRDPRSRHAARHIAGRRGYCYQPSTSSRSSEPTHSSAHTPWRTRHLRSVASMRNPAFSAIRREAVLPASQRLRRVAYKRGPGASGPPVNARTILRRLMTSVNSMPEA